MTENRLLSPRIVITGASGYLGTRFVELAKARSIDLVILGSAPANANVPVHAWRMGRPVPVDVLQHADALIHMAHSWESDEKYGGTPENLNVATAVALFTAAQTAQIPRFVFASSVVAREDSLNAYGRIKFLIEQKIKALADGATTRALFARIGFVYGGPEKGHYGLLCKLVRLSPILPIIGGDLPVKPVYIDEVVEHLLKLALDPPPSKGGMSSAYKVAPSTTMSFADWLKFLRKAKTGGRLILVPVPIGLIRLYAALSPYLPFFPKISQERVRGLQNSILKDSGSDAEDMGLPILNPVDRLSRERV